MPRRIPRPEPSELARDGRQLLSRLAQWVQEYEAFMYLHSNAMNDNKRSDEELADFGLIARQIEREAQHIKKEAAAHGDAIEESLGQLIIDRTLNDVDADTRVRGSMGTATARIKTFAITPRKGDPAYAQLMRHFGLNDAAIEAGLAQVHFRNMQDYVQEATDAGREVPVQIEVKRRPACTFRPYPQQTNNEDE